MEIKVENEWYENFFSGLNCEMWEKAVTPEWTTREANFLIATLNVKPGATLLDIPCGNGRHTIELAKRGFRLTGLDISAEYIEKLNQRVEKEHLPIDVIHGNILTTELPHTFDGAYCMGNSFGYVNYDGMNVFVKKVAAALKPGARFVVNSGLVAESILPNFPKTNRYVLGDLTMDINNSYVIDESYMATQLTYTKEGRTEVHNFKHYVYTLSEIKRWMERFGMRTIAVYNSTEMEPYKLGDQQMFLVAEKL